MIAPLKLRGITKGEAWLNSLRDLAISGQIKPSRDIDVKVSPSGTTLLLKGPAGGEGGGIRVVRMHVFAVKPTYLVCYRINSAETAAYGDAISVLRPFETTLDAPAVRYGGTASNYADSGTTAEQRTVDITVGSKTYSVTEYIHPVFNGQALASPGEGSVIYATPMATNFGATDDNGNAIRWIDINVAGRHWATSAREVEGCVNGVTQTMLVLGSEVAT